MDSPWLGDACALVDAYRSGETSPTEVVDASLAAISKSGLNAFCHVDADAALAAAAAADVSQPFGGVPMGVKEIDGGVSGWPDTHASLAFEGEVSPGDATQVARLRTAGAVLLGLTTASEFGGVNCTHTRLHGTTSNPWAADRTPGGSSGGAAAAVAGGLVPLSTGGDGGGSIRIPAGFCGLFGLKTTFGRIPRGPRTEIEPYTVTVGCVSRSVRDTARWLDVCNGFDPYDPYSLPRVEGWEAGLGALLSSGALRGMRAVIAPTLGAAVIDPRVEALVTSSAEALAAAAGLQLVDVPVELPSVGVEWAMAGLVSLRATLGERWPERNDDLTPEIQLGLRLAEQMFTFDGAARVEQQRRILNAKMADLFSSVDLVLCATSPDVPFAAAGPIPHEVAGRNLVVELGFERGMGNNGALTIPSNIYGNPAMSVPAGTVDGLPVGLQVLAPHHRESVLLDLALLWERERPWPLVAPDAPC